MKIWSLATRLTTATRLAFPPAERKGNLDSRNLNHLPITGPCCGDDQDIFVKHTDERTHGCAKNREPKRTHGIVKWWRHLY